MATIYRHSRADGPWKPQQGGIVRRLVVIPGSLRKSFPVSILSLLCRDRHTLCLMREGLYDTLLTGRLSRALDALAGVTAQTHTLDEAAAPARFAQFLAEEVRRLLGDLDGDERVEKQAVIVNEVLAWLKERVDSEDSDTVVSPTRVLLAIHRTAAPPPRPLTPLATSTLLIR